MKAVIVDDEKHCTKTLKWELEQHCPDVLVEAVFNASEQALAYLKAHPVDLLFLDIEMPHLNGFELLKQVPEPLPYVVFITAYDQFAIDAFKVSAVDYLLKPVEGESLQVAVQKVSDRKQHPAFDDQLQFLMDRFLEKGNTAIKNIALPTSDGLEFVPVDAIIYCQADSSYAHIHFTDRRKLVVTRTLKDLEEMLPSDRFLRVHNSYLVNLNEIRKFVKTDGGYLVMSNGDKTKVSRFRKEALLTRF